MVKTDFWSFRPKHRQLQRLYLEGLWDRDPHGIVSAPPNTSHTANAPQSLKEDAVKSGTCAYVVGRGVVVKLEIQGVSDKAEQQFLDYYLLFYSDETKSHQRCQTQSYTQWLLSLSISLAWWTVCSKVLRLRLLMMNKAEPSGSLCSMTWRDLRTLANLSPQWKTESFELNKEEWHLVELVTTDLECCQSVMTVSTLSKEKKKQGKVEKIQRRDSEWIHDIITQLLIFMILLPNVNLVFICPYL